MRPRVDHPRGPEEACGHGRTGSEHAARPLVALRGSGGDPTMVVVVRVVEAHVKSSGRKSPDRKKDRKSSAWTAHPSV